MTATLRIRVRARASSNRIVVSSEGEVRVYVTVAPERGKANDAVVALLAKALGVGRRNVSLARGHAARDKVVEIEGLDTAEALSRLANG